ncbi:MAG: hypothetical protein AABW46_03245 [Nanoarchaeota archaeon]
MVSLIQLGMFILFLGIILIFLGSFSQSKSSDTKVAVGGFIGPIPFGFLNDKRLFPVLVGLIILGFIIMFLLKRYF